MLPSLANNDNDSGLRPSLPSIRDLFGDHLSKPINKRPSPFSLKELGFSLPSGSSSPADNPGSISSSTVTSPPQSAWSQTSDQQDTTHAGAASYASTRRCSDTPLTSSSQKGYITLPPVDPIYPQSYRDMGRRSSNPYVMTSSQRISNTWHSRSHSTSETMTVVARDSLRSNGSLDPSCKRRHTIGSSRSFTSVRHPYPKDQHPSGRSGSFSRKLAHTDPQFVSHPPITNLYPPASTHPSLTPNLFPVDYPSPSSCPPSPPSTSGEEVSTEGKKKTLAKYECQYCKKRFNRPSSLKLHNNTHTGEKPFACPFPGCGRCFSVLSNMRRHARIHGEPSNRTPRDSSVEDNFEASTLYSESSSSTHNTPIIHQAAIIPSSEKYSRLHSSSATSSPHNRSPSRLEMLRHPSLARPHHPNSYERSQSSLSDRSGSSPEW